VVLGKKSLYAWSLGSYAKKIINDKGGQKALVAHVFDNTIYLRMNNDELILISTYPWRSPFTINLAGIDYDGFSFKSIVSPLQKAVLLTDEIMIGELSIDIGEARVYSGLGKPASSHVDNNYLGHKLRLLLYTAGIIAGGLRDTSTPYLHSRICEYLNSDGLLSDNAMDSLIGLGEGFTPSGDDIYVGLSSAITYTYSYVDEKRDVASSYLSRIKEGISARLNQTTWASGMYLRYALSGLYDETIEKVLYDFYYGDIQDFYSSVVHLLRRGHESGVYLALGVLLGLLSIYNSFKLNWTNKLCSLLIG
jgi:hypothetical protein